MYAKKAFQSLMAILLPLLTLSQRSYNVGDTISLALLQHLQHLPTHAASPLQGSGAYVLTFFSPYCVNSCEVVTANTILSNHFKNTVAFINITKHPSTAVRPKMPAPATIQTNDTVFTRAFPYLRVPHIVIINSKGKVKAITSGSHLTKHNIETLLLDSTATLPLKHDKAYNNKTSLLSSLDLQNTPLPSYIFITPYIEGLPAGTSRKWDSTNNCTRITAVNGNIATLYAVVFNKRLLRPWQVEIDSTVNKSEWCFEYCTPNRIDSIVTQQTLQFLNGHFQTTASIQSKQVQYLALVDAKSTGSLDTTVNVQQSTNNLATAQLYKALRSIPSLPYIENESFSKRTLPASLVQQLEHLNSIPAINLLINPYGLTIAPRSVTTGVLVIKSNPSPQNTTLQ